MSDVTTGELTYAAARIDDLPDLFEGLFRLVREGLGISGFGVQVMDLPPDYVTSSHDETETGQEELYVALRGSGAVIVHEAGGDRRLALDPERIVAVGPAVARTLTSGLE